MIPRDVIERIHDAARIEDVIGTYVTLKKRGANYIGLCPFHQEKTGSFTVNPARHMFKCFGCGKGGDVVSFIMEIEHCSYPEALRTLAQRYHIDLPEREMTPEEQKEHHDREIMYKVNKQAEDYYINQLWETPEGKAVGLSYLHERGLNDDTIRKFELGYSPKWSKLYDALHEAGFEEKFIFYDDTTQIGTGICERSKKGGGFDKFHERIIFPFFSRSGNVAGFTGRQIIRDEHSGKYVNSGTSSIFEKKNLLFGLHTTRADIIKKGFSYLVEGQMDLIQMYQSGITNVVCSGGTSLTEPQVRLLHHTTESVIILYDGDSAGIHAAIKAMNMFLKEGMDVKVVLLPEGEDPDSFVKKNNSSDVISYLEQNTKDLIQLNMLLLSEKDNDPMARSGIIHNVAESIALIADEIKRDSFIQYGSQLLTINENILRKEVTKVRLKNKEEDDKRRRLNDGNNPQQPDGITPPPTPNPPSPSGIPAPKDTFRENIQNILKMVIRYGEHIILLDAAGNPMSVGTYFLDVLRTNSIELKPGIDQKIFNEFEAHCMEEGFQALTFFLHHEDASIHQLACELSQDEYQLSSHFTKRDDDKPMTPEEIEQLTLEQLPDTCQHLAYELQYTVVNERIEQLNQSIREADKARDTDKLRQLLQVQPQLLKARNQICKLLGNRVIMK